MPTFLSAFFLLAADVRGTLSNTKNARKNAGMAG
jgi:hypothetical protein